MSGGRVDLPDAAPDDLLPLFVPIASDAIDFATLRAWFNDRLEPLAKE